MRFTKLIVVIGILLVVAGSIIIFYDQSESKTRICERRILKGYTAVCTWNKLGEIWAWNLNAEADEELFIQLQEAMLADLQTPREEKSSASVPEYNICIRNKQGKFPFEFHINTGRTTWIECNGGTYANRGHTQEFLSNHAKQFKAVSSPPK